MSKLVLEIGFIELLVAVFGAAMMGVLLMVLYHRLAMRRERELMQHRWGDLAHADRPRETVAPTAPGPEPEPETTTSTASPGVVIPDSTDSLDFHSPS